MEYCLGNDAIDDFSVWLITGYNPADINRFQSRTENIFYLCSNQGVGTRSCGVKS